MPTGVSHQLAGSVFGRLTVLSEAPQRGAAGKRQWECLCECGSQKTILGCHLASGATRSCGCLLRDSTTARNITHSRTRTSEHNIWKAMKQRCSNPNDAGYKNYGGRGIYVCERWMDSFAAFLEDMGRRPAGLSLERKNNDGPYAPWNCKWATHDEQKKNKRPRKDSRRSTAA